MKTKKQLLVALLCAFAMLGNSVAVAAQGQDKQDKQSESKPEVHTFIRQNGQVVEVPSGGVTVGEPRVRFSFSTGDAGVVTNGNAPQVQVVGSGFYFDSAVVKNAPYAADAINETVQTLSDGNRIVRNSAGKAYRDSAGRTRREQALNAVGSWTVSGDAPKLIYISDPVAGVQYTLDPRTKTATKINVQRLTNVSGDSVIITGGTTSVITRGEYNGDHSVRGEHSGDHTVKHDGDHVRFVTDDNRSVVLSGDADKALTEVRARATAGAAFSGVTTSGGNVFTFFSEGDAKSESLGTQTIEGVRAEGSRTTFTIPAGKIGNERPIVTVSERWYSPELQVVVMSKTSDPRVGETTYRLANITRAEPDPSLFQVPPDYTIKESGFSFNTRVDDMLKKIEAERKARKPNDNN
jgi:hypothetical protein